MQNLDEFRPLRCQLPKHEAKEMAVSYIDKNGVKRVKGGKDLKSSQSYPRLFFGQNEFKF